MRRHTIGRISRDVKTPISWRHFPKIEKRNNSKARMDIGGMNFIRLEY
jgi:hypothetical protein